jgi:hypothetical protein
MNVKVKIDTCQDGDKKYVPRAQRKLNRWVRESLQPLDRTARIERLNSVRVIMRLDQTARDFSQLKVEQSGFQLV